MIQRIWKEFGGREELSRGDVRCSGSYRPGMYLHNMTRSRGVFNATLLNFTPSIYFGVLTVMAMLAAVMGALLLLPKLIITFKPLGPGAA